MSQQEVKKLGLSSAALHIMAMAFMLLDHMWGTVLAYDWMTCVGRIAFPIFAFMIAEGVTHTRSLKKYMLRMLIFALIAEIPFNLMHDRQLIAPFAQNVLWTFLIALAGIFFMEKAKEKKLWLKILICVGVCIVSFLLGVILFVDYSGPGVLTVYVFYFFHRNRENNLAALLFKNSKYQKTIWHLICFAGQFLCLLWICDAVGGYCYIIEIFGRKVEIVRENFALLALIPIWLYHGRQGYHAKWFQYFNYAFYPAHCLILALIAMLR